MIDITGLREDKRPQSSTIVHALLDRLEAAENDVALKERVIDALGSELNAVANERDELRARIEQMERQEPVAKVRVHRTGGNAGLAWSVAPLNDFDSLPLMRDGDRLYALPGAQAQPAPSIPEGWKLVPIEPTTEMLEAGEYTFVPTYTGTPVSSPFAVYRAMLAAAPEAKS